MGLITFFQTDTMLRRRHLHSIGCKTTPARSSRETEEEQEEEEHKETIMKQIKNLHEKLYNLHFLQRAKGPTLDPRKTNMDEKTRGPP